MGKQGRPRRPLVEVPCDYCGSLVKLTQQRLRLPHHFCNHRCRANYFHTRNVLVSCAYCGKTLLRYPSQIKARTRQFCNRKCHTFYRQHRVKLPCDNCGKVIGVKESNLKSPHHFCNDKCYGQYLKKKSSPIRERVKELRKSNPCLTGAAIAKEVGRSRERVRQILEKEKLPTTRPRQEYICLNCGAIILRKQIFCSRKCSYEYHHPLIECEQCHKLFRRGVSVITAQLGVRGAKHIWCSKKCQGEWFGQHYGGSRTSAYDWDLIWQKHLETGYGSHRLSQLLGIPPAATEYALMKMRQRLGIYLSSSRLRKLNWDLIWQTHLRTGLSAYKLSLIFHCSNGGIRHILKVKTEEGRRAITTA